MKLRSLLLLLCVSEVFQQEDGRGGTALIETQQSVTAAIGGDAHFTCRLMETKDVVRVVWKQLSPHPEKFLALYTQTFGERLNPDLSGKLAFTHAALQSSAIVVKDITDQDEGCYQCVFDTSSEGTFRNQTCLQVYELHEPILHVEGSPEEAVVSCSATGRPGGAQVGCTVRVLSGPQMEVFRTLPGKEQSSPDVIVIVVVVLIGLVCVCAAVLLIIWWLKRNRGNRNSEKDGTPQNSTPPTQGTEMPLLQHKSQHLRQRGSPFINEETAAADGMSSKATSVKPRSSWPLFEELTTEQRDTDHQPKHPLHRHTQ